MPKDVKYIILEFSANVVTNGTKIISLQIIRERQTRRPEKCKWVQNHILCQDVDAFGVSEFGIIIPLFSIKGQRSRRQGVLWPVLALLCLCGVGQCQIIIVERLLNKCQVVWNIIRSQRVLWWVMPFLGVCGVGECKCLFYGDFLTSAKWFEILFDANEFFGEYWRYFAYVA